MGGINQQAEQGIAGHGTELEPESKHSLTINDLMYIHKQSLGLRHVSIKEQAQKEKRTGIKNGDALAIASAHNLLELDDSLSIAHAVNPWLQLTKVAKDPESSQQLLRKFTSVVKAFFADSIGLDMNTQIKDENSPQQILKKLADIGPSFLLARFQGANIGSDMANYYGIGKCHKKNVSPRDIMAVFSLGPEDIEDLISEIPEVPMNDRLFEFIKSRLSQVLFEKFTAKIKEIQSTSH